MMKLTVFTTRSVYIKLIGNSEFMRELIEAGKRCLLAAKPVGTRNYAVAIEWWLIRVDDQDYVTIDEPAWEGYLRNLPPPPD